MDAAPDDRPLSERRLAVYQKLLAANQFRPCTWAKAFCKATDQFYRVNGKHTSTLFSGLEKLPEIHMIVEEYVCDDLEDVAKLYATYDSKVATRTASDINRMFAASMPELSEVPTRFVSAVVSGLSYAKWQENYGSHPAAERAELLLDSGDFCLWFSRLLGTDQKSTTHLRRVAVVAAMVVTWNKSRKDATDFWDAVRDETGETPSAPDRRLAKLLTTVSVCAGRGASNGRTAPAREFYAKSIHAWNAWRRKESMEILKYHSTAKLPSPV